MREGARDIGALLLTTLASACAAPDDGRRWTARDSAGIEILSSRSDAAPEWS